ncbi:hypothetical protein ACFQ36_16050 [Arthrobacter sp. GCM10027362]|uniref:hypothetical protein n=1 Tax=Arthrobacter sp. GCM10027362 TaxID=3273379 RepID=UPI003645965D
MMPLRDLLHSPAVRLILDTAAAALVLSVGLEMIAHANGSTWAPLLGGPAITLAGAHLILLVRAWHEHLRQAWNARKDFSGTARGMSPAKAGTGVEP